MLSKMIIATIWVSIGFVVGIIMTIVWSDGFVEESAMYLKKTKKLHDDCKRQYNELKSDNKKAKTLLDRIERLNNEK